MKQNKLVGWIKTTARLLTQRNDDVMSLERNPTIWLNESCKLFFFLQISHYWGVYNQESNHSTWEMLHDMILNNPNTHTCLGSGHVERKADRWSNSRKKEAVAPPTGRWSPSGWKSPSWQWETYTSPSPCFGSCVLSSDSSVVSEKLMGCRDDRRACRPPPTPSCLRATLPLG